MRRGKTLRDLTRCQRLLLAAVAALFVLVCFVSQQTGLTDRLFLWTGVANPGSVPQAGEIQVHVLDVGQADATVVFCNGKAMLIDAGGSSAADTVISYLQHYGITRLDLVMATHADEDHIGGMDAVLNTFSVGRFLMAAMPQEAESTTATYSNMLDLLNEEKIAIDNVRVGMHYTLGSASISIISPIGTSEETNEQSAVCCISYQNNRFLFTGDAGEEAETALLDMGARLDADFLKVGHHGSEDSTGWQFLRAVNPSVAVISCGENNPYGHPHKATLQRLQSVGAAVYRTDIHGTVVVTGDGQQLHVACDME